MTLNARRWTPDRILARLKSPFPYGRGIKILTFHNVKFIVNALTMELYDRSSIAAILDMQISYFFRAIHQRAVLKNNLRGLDEYWRLEGVWVKVVLEYEK